jgi:hypothetical protein
MNFDVYAGAIDEKFMFLVAKIGMILAEREILGRLNISLTEIPDVCKLLFIAYPFLYFFQKIIYSNKQTYYNTVRYKEN